MKVALVPQKLPSWNDYYDTGNFDLSYREEADYDVPNYNYYDYSGIGITGDNVLEEMRPNPAPTRPMSIYPSFITGDNVVK